MQERLKGTHATNTHLMFALNVLSTTHRRVNVKGDIGENVQTEYDLFTERSIR